MEHLETRESLYERFTRSISRAKKPKTTTATSVKRMIDKDFSGLYRIWKPRDHYPLLDEAAHEKRTKTPTTFFVTVYVHTTPD
jgi:hypothetical protein